MKYRLKNRHGFTLVELLAVIVVLAIIMLIAVQAVLPLLQNARKNAFLVEVNNALDAAQTYYATKAITGETIGSGKCYSLDTLVSAGMYTTKKDTYKGWIEITPSSTNKNIYLYKITMTNGQYAVIGKGIKDNNNVAITADEVEETSTISQPALCTTS